MKHLTPSGWKKCTAIVRPCRYQQTEIAAITRAKANNRYYAAEIPREVVAPFVKYFRSIEKDWPEYEENKKARDRGVEYHITVLTPPEVSYLKKSGTVVAPPNFTFAPIGVGMAEKGSDKAYYIVMESEAANDYRKTLGLPPHDFHTTLGFKEKDVHGVEKNRSTLV